MFNNNNLIIIIKVSFISRDVCDEIVKLIISSANIEITYTLIYVSFLGLFYLSWLLCNSNYINYKKIYITIVHDCYNYQCVIVNVSFLT